MKLKEITQSNAWRLLLFIGVLYLGKFFALVGMAGASMACIEGGHCSVPFLTIVKQLSPLFAYGLGGILLYLSGKTGIRRDSVNKAIWIAFMVHCGFIILILCYMFILSPLAPALLSYHDSPGAQALRFLMNIFPIILASLILVYSGLPARNDKGLSE